MIIINKKVTTTFDRWMENPKIKEAYKEGYEEFVLSEFLRALMEGDEQSVRGLAKKAGLSATVIQDIRSGKQKDMKVKNFLKCVHACGYGLMLDNGKERIPLGV